MKTTKRGYECKKPWPEDCFVQSGDRGVVIRPPEKGGNYGTAFFEAFPKHPDTFIRGEGETIEQAEEQAYQTFQKYQACSHDFERLNDDGRGKCQYCGMTSSHALTNIHECGECGKVGAILKHPEKESKRICVECYAGEAGDRLLSRSLADLLKAEQEDDGKEDKGLLASLMGADEDDPEYESFLIQQESERRIRVRFIRLLLKNEKFQGQYQRLRLKAVERGDLITMKMINRPMMRVVELVKNHFPALTSIEYLDEKAYYTIICESDRVQNAIGEYLYGAWLKENDPTDQDEENLNMLHAIYLDRMVNAIHGQLVEWMENPPEDGESRKRISTPGEFQEGMKSALEALAGGLSGSTES